MSDSSDGKRDFFVSFNQADRAWATWVAWVLEEAGYSVFFQDWDFRGSFPEHMDRAHREAHRTLAVLSDHYLGSEFARSEAWARYAQDAVGSEDRLVPVKVGPAGQEGILRQFVYADLTGCGEEEARQRLLGRVKKAVDAGYRDKPKSRPGFPGGPPREVPERPSFPPAETKSATDAGKFAENHVLIGSSLLGIFLFYIGQNWLLEFIASRILLADFNLPILAITSFVSWLTAYFIVFVFSEMTVPSEGIKPILIKTFGLNITLLLLYNLVYIFMSGDYLFRNVKFHFMFFNCAVLTLPTICAFLLVNRWRQRQTS